MEQTIKLSENFGIDRKIYELREYHVAKYNDLIQKARFQLSLQEQKIILFMISKIKPKDTDFSYQEFSVTDYCKICGIHNDSGNNYRNIKESIKNLSDKSAWIMLDDNTETIVRWINKAWINKKSSTIKIRFDDDMKPFLLHLKNNYTQYQLLYVLAMKSQYSIRLYEILKSYKNQSSHKIFNINELKRLLAAQNYTRYPDLRRKVLDIATKEINDYTDLKISYKAEKKSRRFVNIEFEFLSKSSPIDNIKTLNNIYEKLYPPRQESFLSF